jgi:hypothetical protein
LVIVGCWGCAGDLENPERFGFLLDNDGGGKAAAEIPPPPECLTTLFEMRCNSSACHGAGAPQVDLVSPGIQDRLVGKASTSTQCRPRVYVPTDGAQSLLLEKLEAVPECGIRMPIGDPLQESDLSCVSGWVKAVADASGGN